MKIDEAIKHAEEVANLCEYEASRYDMTDSYESHVACQEGKCAEEHRQLAEWLKELKQLREQKPCEDAISRQSMLNYQQYLYGNMSNEENYELWKFIKALPSVAPARQKGRWIPHRAKYDKTASVYECSICHKNNGFENSKYCPNCGTEMESDD